MKTLTASRFVAMLTTLLLAGAEFQVLDHNARVRQAVFAPQASSVSARHN
jgi:hypothetical protein